MLTRLRKTRQRLLGERRFSNYLLYALGEIVLVVVGILIAVAINNHYQDKATQAKARVYLSGLKTEFLDNQHKLAVLIDVNKSNLSHARDLIELINNRSEQIDETRFSRLLMQALNNDVAYNPNNSLLTEMINSGSLKDIQSVQLRRLLTNWLANVDDIAKQEQDLSLQREHLIDFFRGSDTSFKTVLQNAGAMPANDETSNLSEKSNLHLLESRAFENNLLMFILTSQATDENHYQPLMDNLNTILGLIDEALDN